MLGLMQDWPLALSPDYRARGDGSWNTGNRNANRSKAPSIAPITRKFAIVQ